MLLIDYLDAIAFRANGSPPEPERWVDELRARADASTFAGVG